MKTSLNLAKRLNESTMPKIKKTRRLRESDTINLGTNQAKILDIVNNKLLNNENITYKVDGSNEVYTIDKLMKLYDEEIDKQDEDTFDSWLVDVLKSDLVQIIDNEYSKSILSNKLEETTNKGLDAMKRDFYNRKRQALKDLGDPNWENLTNLKKRVPEDMYNAFEKEEAELRAISMIHSILTYSEPVYWTVEKVFSDRYMKRYIDALGEEKVKELINQEIEEYKNNATINKDVHTDSEGVSYNSVTFANESEKVYKIEQKDSGVPKVELVKVISTDGKTVKVKSIIDDYEFEYDKDFFDSNKQGATDEDIKKYKFSLNESEKLIEEEQITDNLQEVKSQGNVYMLQDGKSKYIVGENYNEEEGLIENAEIYKTKEDADKDYFSRCDIKKNNETVQI